MKFILQNENYPIWDINGFNLDELTSQELSNPDFYETFYKNRKIYKHGSSKIIDNVIDNVPKVKDYLDIFYNETNKHLFGHHWPVEREKFENSLSVSSNIFCDPPGFNMTNHIDNRIQVALTIINLVDNECSTIFHNESMKPMFVKDDYGTLHVSPKTKGSGVMFLNIEDTPHSITHDGNNLRYCIFSYLTLIL
jgi:hypothetical protein